MIILISRHFPNYKLSNVYNPLFAFCLPHTMRIFLSVKQALLTSGYNLESNPFPTTFIPLQKSFDKFLALYFSALTIITYSVPCQVISPTYTETIFSFLPLPPLPLLSLVQFSQENPHIILVKAKQNNKHGD